MTERTDLAVLRQNWDGLGREDPLWSILTVPGTRGGRWTEPAFFASGRTEIGRVLAHLRDLGWTPPRRRALGTRSRALDFGCGIGRLTRALAEYFDLVDGVDIAPSMIRRALADNPYGARCRYVLNDRDDLARFDTGRFAFVYSSYVLQHMPPALAGRYVAEFVRLLRPDGVAVFGLPIARRPAPPPHEGLGEEAFVGGHEVLVPIPDRLRPRERVIVPVQVSNASLVDWPTRGERLVWLGARWERLDQPADGPAEAETRSATGYPVLPAGGQTTLDVELTAPAAPGRYRLHLDLLQEHVRWFERATRHEITVAGDPVVEPEPPHMEMYTTPFAEVRGWIEAAGGGLVDVTGVLASNEEYFDADYVGATFTVARQDGTVDAAGSLEPPPGS
jgi:SAM-dependent methyltransferase